MDFIGYGFTFPFPFICTDDVSTWGVFKKVVNGQEVVIYPPFLSGKNTRLTPDFAVNDSPSLKMRGIELDISSSVPSGFRTLPQCFGKESGEHPPQVEANAFQIEISAKDETKADTIKSWLISAALRNLRRQSGQFWIEHPAIYFEGFHRIQYEVKNNQLSHNMWSNSTVYSGTLRQRVIDFETWRRSWTHAQEIYDTDGFDSLLMAEHQVAGNFIYEASLSCALASEKMKYQLWQKLYDYGHCSRSELKAAKNDTSKPERYFNELISDTKIAFSDDEIRAVRQAWIVRGLVAHGKETQIPRIIGSALKRDMVSEWINFLWSVAHKVRNY